MDNFTPLRHEKEVTGLATNGVVICPVEKGQNTDSGIDITYPYIILSLTLTGTAHALYDMKEVKSKKNDLTVFLPGHIIRPLEYSDDYTHAWLMFDPSKFADSVLKFDAKDMELIYQAPICHLTDEQAANLLSITNVIAYIISRTEEELPRKHRMLEAQLTLAYELYISIRHEQDLTWKKDRLGQLYMQFCDLVVAHHKEERNVNYYAERLGYDARYFSKIFRAYSNGISPMVWIQQYIATQAKQIINEHPEQTVKETAFLLGFPTTGNFCRYFKRATGMTPQEYKERNNK